MTNLTTLKHQTNNSYNSDTEKNDYKFDYTQEREEDEILQNIIITVELLYDNYKDAKIDTSKDDLVSALEFLQDKIKYIRYVQESLNMSYNNQRIEDISVQLDTLTVQENNQSFMDIFSRKTSITLDLLYVVYSKLEFYIDNLL